MNVSLTLASHTNAGKTTLLRTLLRQDIGEVGDRAHVTQQAERHVLVESAEGDTLLLWDTPGFGDSARLVRRLRQSGQVMGWFLTEVWDRFTDPGFHYAQRAMKAVRDESDVVVYVVNASEDPAGAPHVAAELEILRWMERPVLVVLNQSGSADAELAASDERAWERLVADVLPGTTAFTLDAFFRCWVHEDRLLARAQALLTGAKADAMARLRAAWRARGLAVFEASVQRIAQAIGEAASDRESLPGADALAAKAKRLVASLQRKEEADPALREAGRALVARQAERERALAEALIALHGLSGRITRRLAGDVAAGLESTAPIAVGRSGVLGGLVGGLTTGLAADLATGGLTVGLGALVGGVLGALGASGAAHAYNTALGLDAGRVRWTGPLLRERLTLALLLYLAVAHFGRGRGEWRETGQPAAWRIAVEAALAPQAAALDALWARAQEGALADEVARTLEPLVRATLRDALLRLYPDATEVLGKA